MQYGVITLTWDPFFFLGGGGREGGCFMLLLYSEGKRFLLKNKKFNYIRIILKGGEYSL